MDPSLLLSIGQIAGGGEDIFFAHFRSLSTKFTFFLNYLSAIVHHADSYMTTVYHLGMYISHQLMAASSRITYCHKTQIISNWVLCTQMASTITRFASSRASLECGGTGDSHHCLMLSCLYGSEFRRKNSSTVLNLLWGL